MQEGMHTEYIQGHLLEVVRLDDQEGDEVIIVGRTDPRSCPMVKFIVCSGRYLSFTTAVLS
jgi:hypothetical protein